MKNKFTKYSGRRLLFASIFTLFFGLISIQAHATIVITPSTLGILSLTLGPPAKNCEPDCVYDAFNLVNDGTLNLLYKADQGGSDSGSFASSYDTTFDNSPSDPADALIQHLTGSSISCPDCYLAVKDGNHDPSYYFYNLSAWDGLMDLDLNDFWPQQGAISHVSIWGKDGGGGPPAAIPEPVSLLLFGTGLMSLAFIRRRQSV